MRGGKVTKYAWINGKLQENPVFDVAIAKMRGGILKKYAWIDGQLQENPDFDVAMRQERSTSPASVRDFESTDSSTVNRRTSFRDDSLVEIVPCCGSLSNLREEESENERPSEEERPFPPPPPRVRRIAQLNSWSSDEEVPLIMPLSTHSRASQTTRSKSTRLRIAQLDHSASSISRMSTTPSDSNTGRFSSLVAPRNRQSRMSKKLWFRFSGSHQNGRFITNGFQQTGDEEMNQSLSPGGERFNDIEFYEGLLEEKDCVRVDISQLNVFRTLRGISRFYVHYRLTFSDGSIKERLGPPHVFSPGENPDEHVCSLGDGEFLRGIKVYQDEMVRGVTFVTNFQEIHYGGYDGQLYDAITENQPSMRIIAFCGSERNGYCERIGFYSMPFGWYLCGHVILMRELFHRGRVKAPSKKTIKIRIRKQKLLRVLGAQIFLNPFFQDRIEEWARLDDDTFEKSFGSYGDMLRADKTFRKIIKRLFREDDGSIFRVIMSFILG